MRKQCAAAWYGVVLVASLVLSACGGGGDGGGGTNSAGATLVSIAITPPNPSIAKGTSQQFAATGMYSDNTTRNITASAAWNSSNTTVASIDSAATATGIATGSTTITAASGVITSSMTLTVTDATLVSLAVTPANQSIAKGATLQFNAAGSFSDASTQDLTTQVSWSSSDTAKAQITSAGVVLSSSTGSTGQTTITAASGSVSDSTTLTVSAIVASTDPATGATEIPVHAKVGVSFSDEMTAATIGAGTFRLEDSAGAAVTGTFDGNNSIVLFTPTSQLTASTRYTATVSTGVTDAAGIPLAADYTWSFTTAAPPVAPTNLIANITTFPPWHWIIAGNAPISLKWTDNSNDEAGFGIELLISSVSGTSYEQIATVNANASTYLDAAGSCGTSYYRVRAFNQSGGDSPASSPASVTIPEYRIGLQLPQSSLSTNYTLTWTQAYAGFVVGAPAYSIQEATDLAFSNITSTYTQVFTGASQYSRLITKPVGTNATFCYRARLGTDCWTNPTCILVNTVDTTPPSEPTGVSAAAVSGSAITLSWNPSTDNVGVAGYNIYRDGSLIATSAYTTAYTDMGLHDATSYCYNISAKDQAGNESVSSCPTCEGLCRTTLDTTAPSAPSLSLVTHNFFNLLILHDIHITDLSWAGSTDNIGVTKHNIYRCLFIPFPGLVSSCNDFKYWGAETTDHKNGIYQDVWDFCYIVAAVDAAGNVSVRSNTVCN